MKRFKTDAEKRTRRASSCVAWVGTPHGHKEVVTTLALALSDAVSHFSCDRERSRSLGDVHLNRPRQTELLFESYRCHHC